MSDKPIDTAKAIERIREYDTSYPAPTDSAMTADAIAVWRADEISDVIRDVEDRRAPSRQRALLLDALLALRMYPRLIADRTKLAADLARANHELTRLQLLERILQTPLDGLIQKIADAETRARAARADLARVEEERDVWANQKWTTLELWKERALAAEAKSARLEEAARAIFDKRKGAFGTALIECGEIDLAMDIEALRKVVAPQDRMTLTQP